MEENKNHEQDKKIIRLEEKFDNFERKFDHFTDNCFKTLQGEVVWIRRTIIIGFLISITLLLINNL